jgi:hypothetical protein
VDDASHDVGWFIHLPLLIGGATLLYAFLRRRRPAEL